MLIKKSTKCKFMDRCSGCTTQNGCISATGVTSEMRQYLLKILGHRQKTNIFMQRGKEYHEEALSQYPTLAKYKYHRFVKDFYKGKPLILQEVSVCSPYFGLHGIIDKLSIQYVGNTVNIIINDLKPRFNKKYIIQLAVYGMIMMDKDCLIAYDTITPRSKRKKRITKHLYPKKDFKLNINLEIFYYYHKKTFNMKWVQDNVVFGNGQGIMLYIKKERLRKLKLHKEGLFFLEKTKPCSYCKKDTTLCSLYDICQKINYEIEKKSKQNFFGKNKLLVKTKPQIKR